MKKKMASDTLDTLPPLSRINAILRREMLESLKSAAAK
jgi:hypothetical protein